MKVEHRDFRSALAEFLAAKRTLRQAYRTSELSHKSAKLSPILKGDTSDRIGIDSVTYEQMQKLKSENEQLRKLLSLLYTYSLRVHEELDAFSSLDARRSVSFKVRRDR